MISRILKYIRTNAKGTGRYIAAQANKKRKDVVYNPSDLVFLSSRNIKTARPSKKLEDKILGPFPIIGRKGYSY